MLVAADGRTWGGISGGCLERDVARRARGIIEQGEPVLCRYDTTEAPDDDIDGQVLHDLGRSPGVTLGCRGVIDLFIERISTEFPGPIPLIAQAVRERIPAQCAMLIRKSAGVKMPLGMRTLLDGKALPHHLSLEPELGAAAADLMRRDGHAKYGILHHIALADSESIDLFVETLRPPQSLVIFGGGSDVVPLLELARTLGWHVTIVAGSGSGRVRQRFAAADVLRIADKDDPSAGVVPEADAAVVLMTHDFPRDARILESLANRPIRYLGVLGPRSRTERLLAQADGASQWNTFFPAGLDLGADNPELIALAIISEIQAVMAGRPGGLLRDRPGPIYPRAEVET